METRAMTNAKAGHNLRTFYTLIITQTLSLMGSSISGLAIGIWIYGETNNATPLALVAFFAMLPRVALSGIAGVVADRWDRRYVMALSDTGQAVGTVLLLISFVSGDFQLWHLYLVTFVQAIFGVLQGQAFTASVTMLVPDEHRDRANAVQVMTGPAAGLVAPAAAGIIYSLVGVSGAILLDILTFLIAVVVVLRVHIPHPEQSAEGKALSGSFWKESISGVYYLLQKRSLFALVMEVMLLNFLLAGTGVLLTPYILSRTGSEITLGVLLSLMNLGALVGAVIMSAWGGTRPRIHTILPGMIAGSLFVVVIGVGQHPAAIGVGIFSLMFMTSLINPAFLSLAQAKIPPDIQGRVFAVIMQLAMLVTPLSYLLVGPLADAVFEPAVGQAGWETVAPLVGSAAGSGIGMIFVIAGVLACLSSLIAYAVPAIRNMEATIPDHQPVEMPPDENRLTPDSLPVA